MFLRPGVFFGGVEEKIGVTWPKKSQRERTARHYFWIRWFFFPPKSRKKGNICLKKRNIWLKKQKVVAKKRSRNHRFRGVFAGHGWQWLTASLVYIQNTLTAFSKYAFSSQNNHYMLRKGCYSNNICCFIFEGQRLHFEEKTLHFEEKTLLFEERCLLFEEKYLLFE